MLLPGMRPEENKRAKKDENRAVNEALRLVIELSKLGVGKVEK